MEAKAVYKVEMPDGKTRTIAVDLETHTSLLKYKQIVRDLATGIDNRDGHRVMTGELHILCVRSRIPILQEGAEVEQLSFL